MHKSQPLQIAPAGRAALAAILFHGRGGTAEDMRALAAAFGFADIRYLLPQAEGRSWYPKSFLAPREENEPWLSAALDHAEALVAALMAEGFAAGKILLGGFSQGACLTAAFLARHPRRYAGALILTGGLIGPAGTSWPVRPALAGMPVLLTGSAVDPHVPAWRTRETQAWLEACGAQVETLLFAERAHTVAREEIKRAHLLIERAHR